MVLKGSYLVRENRVTLIN
jgi:3D (Asp-Asp-Asp) domain-containing protein